MVRRDRHGGRRRARGQTGVDFLVGIGVFLLTVGFVVAFAPGLFAPFVEEQAEPMVADRAADTLVADLLAGAAPSVLDGPRTVAYFRDTIDDRVATDLGIASSDDARYSRAYRANVTLERAVPGSSVREVLCGTTASTPAVHACERPPVDTLLAVGPTAPTTTESVATATRVVSVDGTDAVLVVRLW